MTLSDLTDRQRLSQLAPVMREPIAFVQGEAQSVLDERDPGLFVVRINETFRSDAQQWARYAKGREQDPATKRWRIVDPSKMVTNAMPGESAHNILASDGVTPASLAADLWILHRETGALLRNGHLAWAVIPSSAHVSPVDLASGAFFSIKGGDWPHLEHATWKDLVLRGRLRG